MTDMTLRRPRGRRSWLGAACGTSSGGPSLDAALVVARTALAWVFVYYGASKLFGAFPGPGPHGIHQTSLYFANVAHLKPGGFFAVLGGVTEFGGGIAMALGLFARPVALALFGDMVIAIITVTGQTGFSSATNPPGYQLNVAMAALALVVTLAGAGRLSVDGLIARRLQPRNGR